MNLGMVMAFTIMLTVTNMKGIGSGTIKKVMEFCILLTVKYVKEIGRTTR